MARKPEATFVSSVNKYLPKEVHSEGMANEYRGGTPDRYYEGNKDELWVEYKFLQVIPPVINLLDSKARVKLSPLQQKWLDRAYGNGRNIAVIVGCKEGGVILTHDRWNKGICRGFFKSHILSRKDIAYWIIKQVSK